METIELLRRLSEAVGVSGHEDDVRDIVVELVTPLVDDVRVDVLGNVLATRRGRSEDVLLLDAHTDEVGFLVSHIDESGFLRLFPVGGWDPRVLPSHAVTFRTADGGHVRGVIGTKPPHVTTAEERKKAPQIEDLFVDVGATSADDVASLGIRLGTPGTPAYPFEVLGDDLVMGKAFDDRAGCTVALRTLEALRDTDLELTVVTAFVTGEEVGLRGARTAAHQVAPKIALALEGTTAVDVPGVKPTQRLARFGSGPAITVADRSLIADKRVVMLLERVAAEQGIPHHIKLPGGGGTDAAAIQITGAGALCGVVSVPCRYIHTPLSTLRPSDLEATIRLTTAFVGEAASLL